ncbi:hypothetical protein SDC9_60538 [bioreactor metagenome]|uniref:Single-stranded DNA-binding protein n=1 Tax=bioreactor metagenome TaxID=1076179 RepID=A0A644XEI3_9ZZZZ
MSLEASMNLYQKLAKIRKMVGVMQKNKAGYGYKYTTEDEILAKITAGMEKYSVSLLPIIKSGTSGITPYKYVDKKGKDAYEIIVNADMLFRWVNDENPAEFIDVDWLLVGQQSDAAQAVGSGLTYCNRYFLLKYFQVSTVEDDPDNWRSKKQAAIDEESMEELKQKHAEIIELAAAKISAGANKEAVYKIIADNTGGKKNPNAIKDIVIAQKVYNEINTMEVKDIAE